jgi:hypothetical protein
LQSFTGLSTGAEFQKLSNVGVVLLPSQEGGRQGLFHETITFVQRD